jgi:hypothetical protein
VRYRKPEGGHSGAIARIRRADLWNLYKFKRQKNKGWRFDDLTDSRRMPS